MTGAARATPQPIFAAEGFAKRFGETEVLKAAAVQVRPGRVTVLLGRNGSGKSTLLRCALGLLRTETGSVLWRGRATLRPRISLMAPEGLFFVPDRGLAVPSQRVGPHFDSLRAAYPGVRKLEDWDPLNVAPFLGARIRQLSTGERRRVELTLALLRNPACLIADEPLTGLAPNYQSVVTRALRDAAQGGSAVLITGHEVECLMAVADEVVWIVAGGTRVLGPPEQAWAHPEFARQYLGRRRPLANPWDGSEPGLPGRESDRGEEGDGQGEAGRRVSGWVARAGRVWLPLAGSAAAVWFAVRVSVAMVGAAAGVSSSFEMRSSLPLVGLCVLLTGINHRRRGAARWFGNLGMGRGARVLIWGLTCLALEFLATAAAALLP